MLGFLRAFKSNNMDMTVMLFSPHGSTPTFKIRGNKLGSKLTRLKVDGNSVKGFSSAASTSLLTCATRSSSTAALRAFRKMLKAARHVSCSLQAKNAAHSFCRDPLSSTNSVQNSPTPTGTTSGTHAWPGRNPPPLTTTRRSMLTITRASTLRECVDLSQIPYSVANVRPCVFAAVSYMGVFAALLCMLFSQIILTNHFIIGCLNPKAQPSCAPPARDRAPTRV